jgi:hypothetical protein
MIEALATNPAIVANFGACFSSFRRAADCLPCGTRARRGTGDYATVRDCLGGLPAGKKLLLKRLLNAGKVRLDVRRGNAKVTLTF